MTFNFLSNTVRPDGMVSATALTTAYRHATISEKNPNGITKNVKDWLKTATAQESIAFLAERINILTTELVIAEHGVGTWIHPKLAPILAMWISPEFQFAVVELIEQHMNPLQPQVTPVALPSRDLAVETAVAIDKIQDLLGKSNPRLAQILVDCALNDVIDQRQLPAAAMEFPEDKWYGAVQIAEAMGIKTNSSTRVKLGQYLMQFDLERVREKRLCNGQMQLVWCYRDDAATREAIQGWHQSIG